MPITVIVIALDYIGMHLIRKFHTSVVFGTSILSVTKQLNQFLSKEIEAFKKNYLRTGEG